MARALGFDLGDGGVLGVGEDGSVFGPSPGVALVEPQRVLFGQEALRASRLKPRQLASDFWTRLDDEPLGPPFPPGLRAVDLVHGHLESLWREAKPRTSEVLLAVPGDYDERQLGRLAGVAHALGLPVSGVVDSALAAASAGFTGERLLHVDLGHRRARVTQIRQGAALVRERVASIERWGSDEVLDAQMRGAAEAFVKQARFDPLHDAPTEQALFDRLPGLDRGARARGRRDGGAAGRGPRGRDAADARTGRGLDRALRGRAAAAGERPQAHGRADGCPGLGARGAPARPRRAARRGARRGGVAAARAVGRARGAAVARRPASRSPERCAS